ncbi:outer membrane lipoprotein-sorting protein [Luteolibacter yonseiensis]|uniref:Outer membrane lipoprotein-sorting protein n=1 Tax=Luteolibacter yonseiensis TaxID=1144680 RepID=A0A934V961_9BACT|nr:outer membrane lipoprotein-sorting protein [Luteolibacter yonseiensis]MBK1817987.1 outer membrane lipoprotein-sorting protein [Luteolibacter yonseiensis]
MKAILILSTLSALVSPTFAQEADAKSLATQLAGLQQDGSSFAKVKMDVTSADGAKQSLQFQIKQRRSANTTEVVYQILWPKERMGEAVLLKRSGVEMSGTLLTLPDKVRNLSAAELKGPLLGTSLSCSDVLEDFFSWENQKIVGEETVNRVKCQILESKSGSATVRSWIDTKRVVPLRIEKYLSSGNAFRRIEAVAVNKDDNNRNIPSSMTVQDLQKGTTTSIDGSKLKHGVTYDNSDFTAEGLKNLTPPR